MHNNKFPHLEAITIVKSLSCRYEKKEIFNTYKIIAPTLVIVSSSPSRTKPVQDTPPRTHPPTNSTAKGHK